MTTSKPLQLRFLTRSTGIIVALPRSIIYRWNLQGNNEILISFGHNTVRALLKQHFGNDNQIWISRELASSLQIPFTHNVLVKSHDNTIFLGPLVGIVTCDVISDKGFPFSKNYHTFFSSLLKLQKSYKLGGYFFVFDINSVDWDRLTVEGVFLSPETEGWERFEVPFPDVVYNKILSRTREKRPDSQRFIELLHSKSKAQLFNEKYFHKWEIYERLSTIDGIAHLIPETYFNPPFEKIVELIRRYPMVYFKPVDGFMGLGIYQVQANWNRLVARFRQKNKNITRTYPSVMDFLQRQLPLRKLKGYIVQQGIDLATYDGQPIDFRVHLNKNIHNEWEVTGVGAKVAGRGSVTTHMKAGGKILPPNTVLQEVFPSEADALLDELKEYSIKIAKALESSFQKPIGELGLDMGIDQSGSIWMFEANSKPGRAIFQKIDSLRGKSTYCNKLLIDYSTHLANFS